MRLFVLVMATAAVPLNADEPPARLLDLPLVFRDDFETGDPAARWEPSDPKAWKLTEQNGNNMKEPVMTAIDKTFTWGQIGIGSFDDTGNFDNVLIYGNKATRPAGAM